MGDRVGAAVTGVPVWRGYAYKAGGPDDGSQDEQRDLADWQLEDFLRFCRVRGFDSVYLYRTGDTVEYVVPPRAVGRGARHFWHGWKRNGAGSS